MCLMPSLTSFHLRSLMQTFNLYSFWQHDKLEELLCASEKAWSNQYFFRLLKWLLVRERGCLKWWSQRESLDSTVSLSITKSFNFCLRIVLFFRQHYFFGSVSLLPSAFVASNSTLSNQHFTANDSIKNGQCISDVTHWFPKCVLKLKICHHVLPLLSLG